MEGDHCQKLILFKCDLVVHGSYGDPDFLEPRRVCVHEIDKVFHPANGNLVNMVLDPLRVVYLSDLSIQLILFVCDPVQSHNDSL